MNSDKHRRNERTAGNAMIYIILSLALLAGLTVVMMRQNNQSTNEDATGEKGTLTAANAINYTTQVRSAFDQMVMTGTAVASVNYVRPSEAGYDTPPSINKIFHPQGGGLSYKPADPMLFTTGGTPAPQWIMGQSTANIPWTPTTALDVLLVAYGIQAAPCAAINKKLTGSAVIPVLSSGQPFWKNFPFTMSPPVGVINAANCPGCDEKPALCVSDSGAATFAFYTIISAQ